MASAASKTTKCRRFLLPLLLEFPRRFVVDTEETEECLQRRRGALKEQREGAKRKNKDGDEAGCDGCGKRATSPQTTTTLLAPAS